MIRKAIVFGLAVFLIVAVDGHAMPVAPKKPPREVFGLSPGMSEESVHRRLRKIATQQKEEREEEEGGEQEVWILKSDSRFNYVVTRFAGDHRLTFVTVVAHPNRVRYSEIADIDEATKATDGANYSYKWKVEARRKRPGYLLIAHGISPEFLTSYSLYTTR